ncbi:hypothetical protein [Nonomuraea rhizosphaerae]|uniref:hypothetical protein n=1 Tax=Nonomuraea rhizosphaerae TaxID=2665663 RepID=UPI001C5F765F|nr:hypothetical protein [Nonomuraea rhizosphaerae]
MTVRARVVIPVGAAALAVAAVGGWLWLGRAEPRPSAFQGEPTSAMYALINERQSDAAPLTLDEVFTADTATLGPLRRESAEQLTDCDEALWGASATGCTQALRATYSGEAGAGQFVIFNLADGRAADALVSALSRSGFVRQAVPFDAAHSRAQARALGHYVTVAWAGPVRPEQPADLVPQLLALDRLGHVVQQRVIAAT